MSTYFTLFDKLNNVCEELGGGGSVWKIINVDVVFWPFLSELWNLLNAQLSRDRLVLHFSRTMFKVAQKFL